jgi:hypothetical protein
MTDDEAVAAERVTIVGVRRVEMRGNEEAVVERGVPIDKLRASLRKLLVGLQSIVDQDFMEGSVFELSEVEFAVELGIEGEFKLLGSGVSASASSSVTILLRRKVGGS